MKKSLYAILVILLTAIGANALAAKCDVPVKRVATETEDKTSNDNQNGKNYNSRER